MTYELRALSTGEVLDAAITLLKRNFALLLGVAVVCEGIPTAIEVYVDLAGGASANPGLTLLDRLLSLVGGVLVTGATVRVVSEAYLGQTPLFSDAMRFAFSKFGNILGANILSGLVTVLAALLLIVPGIIVACGYSVASAAAALESGSGSDALKRSWGLTKGFKWKALWLWVVSIGLILVLYLGAGTLAGLLNGVIGGVDALVALLGAAISLLIYPLISCVFTVFYYDLRVRKEGFDLEMLSRQLTAST